MKEINIPTIFLSYRYFVIAMCEFGKIVRRLVARMHQTWDEIWPAIFYNWYDNTIPIVFPVFFFYMIIFVRMTNLLNVEVTDLILHNCLAIST